MHTLSSHGKILGVRARQIAPIVLILVGAVGCTSGGSGGATSGPTSAVPTSTPAPVSTSAPSTPASPSPTPTVATTGPNVRPGEKPPVLGSLGQMNTPAGADAYAHYWIRTLDWAYATNSSSLARTVFAATCGQCAHFLTFDIDQIAREKEHYVGGRLITFSSQVQPSDGHAGATAVIDLHVSQTPFDIVSAAGTRVDGSADRSTATFRTWLKWDQRWTVVDWKMAVQK